jgi:hypothetical protein
MFLLSMSPISKAFAPDSIFGRETSSVIGEMMARLPELESIDVCESVAQVATSE